MSDRKADTVSFLELLNPESKNFLGSGLTMKQWLETTRAIEYESSWFNAERDERKRRMEFVKALSVMWSEHVRKHGIFGTACYDWAIQAVIEGRVKDLELAKAHGSFDTEPGTKEENAAYYAEEAKNFQEFMDLCDQAIVVLGAKKEKLETT